MVFLSFLGLNLFLSHDIFGIMIKAVMIYYATKQHLLTGTMLGIMIPNIYANNINTTVTSFAKECIPNPCINVKPS